MSFQQNSMSIDPREAEADTLADAAMRDLGANPLGLPDEYNEPHEHAGRRP